MLRILGLSDTVWNVIFPECPTAMAIYSSHNGDIYTITTADSERRSEDAHVINNTIINVKLQEGILHKERCLCNKTTFPKRLWFRLKHYRNGVLQSRKWRKKTCLILGFNSGHKQWNPARKSCLFYPLFDSNRQCWKDLKKRCIAAFWVQYYEQIFW